MDSSFWRSSTTGRSVMDRYVFGRCVVFAFTLAVSGAPALHASSLGSANEPVVLCHGRTPTMVGSGTIVGTAGDDVILGSDGPDDIDGRGGNDVICGRGGD